MTIIEAVEWLKQNPTKAIYSKSNIMYYVGLKEHTLDINSYKLVDTRKQYANDYVGLIEMPFEFNVADILLDDWCTSEFRTYEEYYNSI